MKLAVVGSRDFSAYGLLRDELNKIEEITEIVSGGARGADSLAEFYAKKHGIKPVVFEANWIAFGKPAGNIRNTSIVNYCDQLIAFWDGHSSGTKDSINKAKAQGKLLKIVYYVEIAQTNLYPET